MFYVNFSRANLNNVILDRTRLMRSVIGDSKDIIIIISL